MYLGTRFALFYVLILDQNHIGRTEIYFISSRSMYSIKCSSPYALFVIYH